MAPSTTTTTRSSTLALSALSLLLVSQPVLAHIGIWHPSVYGFNATGAKPEEWFADSINTNWIKNPLRKMDNLKFDDWWFHGLRGATPNQAMELPAGGRIMIEHSCNKAWTSYGLVEDQKQMIGNMPCDVNMRDGHPTYGDYNLIPDATNGPMHVADKSDAKGCGLAIAYTDDVWSIKPEDFTVFSVNHTCVWERETYFDIPADMPACPDGKKCICSWNWIHGTDRGEGYGNELYMIGFDCTVTKSKANAPALAKPQLPVSCVGDESKCVKGAKQALYWQGAQGEGWNIPDTGYFNNPMTPPFYNDDYGFKDGAQNDIFVSSGGASGEEAAPVNQAANRVDVIQPSVSSSTSSSTPEVQPSPSSSSSHSAPEVQSSSSPPASQEIRTGIDREPLITITSTRTHVKTVYAEATPDAQRLRRDIGGLASGRMRLHRRRSSSQRE